MPGVSVILMSGLSSKRCCDFVTAGSSPTLATRRLSSAFMKVDFPTLGMPIIIIRSGLIGESLWGASAAHSLGILAASPGFLQEMATALTLGC